jgi:hypothetical protein
VAEIRPVDASSEGVMKRLSLLPVGFLLLGLLSCSQAPKPGDPKPKLDTQVVGKWKHIRANEKPVTIQKDETGLIEIRADGTMTYEEVTEIKVDNKVDTRNVKRSQGKYRFLDDENMEIEGEDRGQIKKWTVKVALRDNVLSLHKLYGQVDEFERVP